MNAAAQTSEPTNPPTGAERLLAVGRWIVVFLLVRWLVGCARKLTAVLQLGPTDPDDSFLLRHFVTTDTAVILPRVTRALRRATALEAELHARRPAEQGFSIETCRAIATQMIAICRDLGILRRAPARIIPYRHRVASHLNRVQRRSFPRALRSPTTAPETFAQPAATGPPGRGGFETRPYETEIATWVCHWSFSKSPVLGLRPEGAPASFASCPLT